MPQPLNISLVEPTSGQVLELLAFLFAELTEVTYADHVTGYRHFPHWVQRSCRSSWSALPASRCMFVKLMTDYQSSYSQFISFVTCVSQIVACLWWLFWFIWSSFIVTFWRRAIFCHFFFFFYLAAAESPALAFLSLFCVSSENRILHQSKFGTSSTLYFGWKWSFGRADSRNSLHSCAHYADMC